MKKLTSIILIICLVFLVSSPAFAKKGGGGFKSGGSTKPKTTTTDPASNAGKTTDQPASGTTTNPSNTTNTTNTGTGDKIPYTNLPASKVSQGGATAAGVGANQARSNLAGFRPSFSPFSGNFWFWMFLMSSFGHSQPAVAQTGENPEQKVEGSSQEAQDGIYTPSVGDYWAADPLANTISTLILILVIALPIVFFVKWRKKRALQH
ncbi:hypothetical protein [Desulforamulus ferrireducens]|uniref:Uncharacterized protein n=1 Tax=Desulforamulus ferrireducens TaxID=1833852 RepID=A0A1S6IYN3_9FIRM|nr:hypothetical protein [Desulforamulus ferrireducens]AQS59870.1 hypothetical protein B0537_12710 [Desulforamulus ferrireducens]